MNILNNQNGNYKAGSAINKDTGAKISWGDTLKGETINHNLKSNISISALNNIYDIVETAILLDTNISLLSSKNKMKNTAFMHSFYTIFDNKLLKLYVEEALSNKGNEIFTRAYQLKDIKKIADNPGGVHLNGESLTEGKPTTIFTIADLFSTVKSYDKEFSPKICRFTKHLLQSVTNV